jgi:periplasmic protein CpxP/Spy
MKLVLATLATATSLAFASGAFAQTAASAPAPSAAMSAKAEKADKHLEARIKELHRQLQITPQQEPLWSKVADTMRSNADSMHQAYEARMSKSDSFTAVDDLKSYGDLAQAHADGVKNLESAFEPLYAALSDTQKKAADEAFRNGAGKPHSMSKGKAKHSAPIDPASDTYKGK